MKKILIILLALVAATTAFVGCKAKSGHKHTPGEELFFDETGHWYVCTKCEEQVDYAEHFGGTATCTEKAVCEVCGVSYGELGEHVTGEALSDETEHWFVCEVCGEEVERAKHYGGAATCTEKAICEACGKPYGELLAHDFGDDGYCKACGQTLAVLYTAENPCVIATAEDLYRLSLLEANDADLTDCYFIQTEDIDISEYENWRPIGSVGIPFEGNYDGQEHEVAGLTINSAKSYLGLFGFVTGSVKNLTVRGEITGINENNYGYAHTFAGGIAGGINNGAYLYNCVNYVNVTGDSYVGGVVGCVMKNDYLLSGTDFSIVENCTNYGKVTAYAKTATNEHAMYYGGVVGMSNGVMINCENYGEVDGDSNSTSDTEHDDWYVGGVAGYSYIPFKNGAGPNDQMNYTAMYNCVNYGYVHGTYGVGGVVGQATLTIDDCRNEGKIRGTNCVGGVVGICGTSGTIDYEVVTVKNCTNIGEVYAKLRNVGGIAGYNYRTVENCVNEGKISYVEGSKAYYAGGVVGTSLGEVLNCVNKGDVYATSDGNCSSGGVVGNCTDGSIVGCKNYGAVYGLARMGGVVGHFIGSEFKNNDNYGAVTGTTRVGGVIGLLSIDTPVQNSENNEEATVTALGYLGGVIGQVDGSVNALIKNCTNRAKVVSIGETKETSLHIGGVIGILGTGDTATECYNYGEVSGIGDAETNNAKGGVGGVVGSSWTNATVTSCVNYGAVTANANVGGVLGYKYGEGTTENNENQGTVTAAAGGAGGVIGLGHGSVINNVNRGKVTGAAAAIGGIVGDGMGGTMKNNANYGEVTSTSTCVAGVIGRSDTGKVSLIENCNNYGAVTGKQFVGGIIGADYSAEIINCANDASVTATYRDIGGIVGWLSKDGKKVDGCVNGKNAVVSIDSSSDGYYIGGIVGRSGSASQDNVLVVTNCVNDGKVVITSGKGIAGGVIGNAGNSDAKSNTATLSGNVNNGEVSGPTKIGGIIGQSYLSTVGANENNGKVTATSGDYAGGCIGFSYANGVTLDGLTTTASSSVTGAGNYIGGIVGRVGENVANVFTVINCVNKGSVTSLTAGKNYVGGVIGELGGTKSNSGTVYACVNEGTVTAAGNRVAGIAGSAELGTAASPVKFILCVNKGDVTSVGNYGHIGGVVGMQGSYVQVFGCENSGNITGVGTSTAGVGGISGSTYTSSTIGAYTDDNGVETPSKVSGVIKGTNKVGAIVGYNSKSTSAVAESTASVNP